MSICCAGVSACAHDVAADVVAGARNSNKNQNIIKNDERMSPENKLSAKELVARNVRLFSLPEVCLQVQALASDATASMDDIGKVVIQDAALTAQLLRIVNSPFYGFRSRIDTISRALSIVGTRELIDMTLAFSVIEVFKKIPEELVDMVSFWRHSIFCGLVSQRLARHCSVLHGERLFIAGLLHDLGKLIIFYNYPELSARVLEQLEHTQQRVCEVEEQVIGVNHAHVGGELLAQWGLPEVLVETVANHHAPGDSDKARLESAIVHVANALTNYVERLDAEQGSHYYDPYALFLGLRERHIVLDPATLDVTLAAWELMQLADDDLHEIIRDASDGFEEVLQTLYPI